MNAKQNESEVRNRIDKILENLGYFSDEIDGKFKHVYREQPRTEQERKKLNGKRPDYVIYSESLEMPIMIIEAKRKGENLDKALKQGICYAKILNALLVFATDGVFYKSYHVKFEKTLLKDSEELDSLIREPLALKYFNEWNVRTISEKVQCDRRVLIEIFNEANDMLRGEGLRAGIERFGEFANILFLKLISEAEDMKKERNEQSKFDEACHWDYIKKQPLNFQIEHVNTTVYKKLNALYGTEIFTPLQMTSSAILKEIINRLNPLKLSDVDSDVKGDAFEYFIKASSSTGNDLGEYFTPRHIVKTIVKLVNPQFGEKVYDPFCGTGGLLIESFKHIWNAMPRNPENNEHLKSSTIWGNEITNTARITKMNMILAGDGHSNIKMMDSLASPIDGKFDVVLTNMPYSQKTRHKDKYDIASNNGDSVCVQHCIKAINGMSDNGRMAIIVPEGFLFRKDLTKTREYLLNKCNLRSVISLPQGVFLPYTGVKTNILYCEKVNNSKRKLSAYPHYWYFEVKNDGYTLDNYRRKIEKPNDLDKYIEANEIKENGFEEIPFEKVKEHFYILVGSRYRNIHRDSVKSEIVTLGDETLFEIVSGGTPNTENTSYWNGNINWITLEDLSASSVISDITNTKRKITEEGLKHCNAKILPINTVIVSSRATIGRVGINHIPVATNQGFKNIVVKNLDKILPKYLAYTLTSKKDEFIRLASGTTFKEISKASISTVSVPLPPLSLQKEVVNELEGYRKIIDGARAILDNYRPSFNFDDFKCASVFLGDENLFEIILGGTPKTDNSNYWGGDINWFTLKDFSKDAIISNITSTKRMITQAGLRASNLKILPVNTVIIAGRATVGLIGINHIPTASGTGFKSVIIKDQNKILPTYLAYILASKRNELTQIAHGTTFKEISKADVATISIPLPSLEVQEQIIQKIKSEQKLIASAQEIKKHFEEKIRTKINKLFS